MPMFEDELDGEPVPEQHVSEESISIPISSVVPGLPLSRKLSEESIRTELCEGPVPDSPKPRTPERNTSTTTVSDRAELIERLKKGESPTWVPNRHLESLFRQADRRSPSQSPQPPTAKSPTLLPAATFTSNRENPQDEEAAFEQRLREGLNIERPRSALHTGDFTHNESPKEDDTTPSARHDKVEGGPAPLAHGSWIATSPPRHFTPFNFERRIPFSDRGEAFGSGRSSLSSSLSSSFVYQAPTSPLVQSHSNDDVDLTLPMNDIDITASSPRSLRRHTLNFAQGSPINYPHSQRQLPFRREGAHPYQAHQPRRSLTSTPNYSFAGSSPQTPGFVRPRRPSFSSDASPLQHASMVGSYEESILRGRMSTTPSKPLDFMAQIGVLGLGKCKPSLRCPSHVTLPFSAVFYSYASTSHGRTKMEDGPSPYVGQIDLENGLSNPEEAQRAKRKAQSRYAEKKVTDGDLNMEDVQLDASDPDSAQAKKQKRRSRSPKAPPGGRYRIPEKGQLQIIIKNQNKTAVKLFLVPYDLAGMEPSTKTFIRQRIYSAGPIIDNVPDLKDGGTADRPILRYLIHLHICSPSKGRFYLYKSIRVVFANRVPDGKEKLRNEVTFPEPRFMPYKPVRVMHPPLTTQTSGPGALLAAEKAFRRRSSGFSFGQSVLPVDGDGTADWLFEPPVPPLPPSRPAASSFGNFAGGNFPVNPVPFQLPRPRGQSGTSESSEPAAGVAHVRSPGGVSSQASRPTTQDTDGSASSRGAPWPLLDDGQVLGRYDKLSKGDVGYGGNAFVSMSNGSPGAAEGLLSKRLRSLGVQGPAGQEAPGSSDEQ